MKAIIVAGGRGERLKPLTDTIPKPMIELGGKPLLQHTIELFKKNGISDIILSLCYLPDVIQNYFGDGKEFGVNISYTYENPEKPLGTAGAIIPAKEYIDETFIVTYADILRDLDIKEMVKAHKESGSIATLNTYKHSGYNHKSTLGFNDQNELLHFTELAESTRLEEGYAWSNGSFYIFEPKIFNYIKSDTKTDFSREVFPALLSNKEKVSVFPTNGYFIDIGTKENLDQAAEDLLNSKI